VGVVLAGATSSAALAAPPTALERQLADLQRDRQWPAGAIQQQLDRDPTAVPFGKGAIFVPAMTTGLDEPIVSVWRRDQKVAEGIAGTRIVLLPGTYRLQFGSGTASQWLSAEVEVQELQTAVVPVSWAGLAVHMVDEHFNSLRGSYELIKVETREFMGVGFGADEQAGEPVATWIAMAGLYKIVRVGDTYRARKDFATVMLTAGELTHFLLVVNDDGTFAGAGVIGPDELFVGAQHTWASLVVGGDLSFDSSHNVLGRAEGDTYAFRGFLDAKFNWSVANNPLIVRLQLEEGQSKAPALPWEKNQDLVDLAALYVYRFTPWLGPYARGDAQTNLLQGRQDFASPTDVVIRDAQGNIIDSRAAATHVILSPPLGLITVKEGTGVNARVVKAEPFEMTLRAGLGARHRLTRQLLQQLSAQGATPVEFGRVANVNQVGIEAIAVAAARLSRWLVANTEIEMLAPFDAPRAPVIDAEGTLSAKITEWVGVNYVLRYQRDPTLAKPTRYEHSVLLRFSLAI
jgi:hypothetical protein